LSRWATFLGVSSAGLAVLQYAPQLAHTYKMGLVGALSIPMMMLQTPGTVFMIISIMLRPGTNWTSKRLYPSISSSVQRELSQAGSPSRPPVSCKVHCSACASSSESDRTRLVSTTLVAQSFPKVLFSSKERNRLPQVKTPLSWPRQSPLFPPRMYLVADGGRGSVGNRVDFFFGSAVASDCYLFGCYLSCICYY
jgi:hypothetical protein